MSRIIYSYAVPLTGLLFLLYLININYLFSKEQNRLFRSAVFINVILIVVTSFDFIFRMQADPSVWYLRRITSFLNFSGGSIIPMLLMRIFYKDKFKKIYYIPLLINAGICFISIFVKIVFYIGTDNSYDRGALFFLPAATTLFYLVLMIFFPAQKYDQGKKTEQITIAAIMVTIILSIYLEVEYRYYFLNYGFSALGIIIYYISQNINFFAIDSLTGAYNRQMFNLAISKTQSKQDCMLCLIDINNFKYINDTFGHEAGDEALIFFSEVIIKNMRKIATVYRTGGDEFMLMGKKESETVLKDAIEKSMRELGERKISFAYGMTHYQAVNDIQDALREIDKKMYENKKQATASL
ncbi:GGDEF domain-containing protein [uncultured Robinsoniella sp.]|uniref:GGDEF domain-containing protein n=1 Tax=uncultured Robinsoniella sp. TaxID=904190 RepID=UPI00374EA614